MLTTALPSNYNQEVGSARKLILLKAGKANSTLLLIIRCQHVHLSRYLQFELIVWIVERDIQHRLDPLDPVPQRTDMNIQCLGRIE